MPVFASTCARWNCINRIENSWNSLTKTCRKIKFETVIIQNMKLTFLSYLSLSKGNRPNKKNSYLFFQLLRRLVYFAADRREFKLLLLQLQIKEWIQIKPLLSSLSTAIKRTTPVLKAVVIAQWLAKQYHGNSTAINRPATQLRIAYNLVITTNISVRMSS